MAAGPRVGVRRFLGVPGGLFGADRDEYRGLQVFRERRVVGHSAAQMCALVAAVDQYSRFVPWCVASRIVSNQQQQQSLSKSQSLAKSQSESQSKSTLIADLTVGFQAFNESYTSRVEVSGTSAVRAEASNSSVFRTLINEWKFLPVPAPYANHHPHPNACLVEFYVGFEFRHAIYSHASALFMDQVAAAMVSAFEDRARAVYGKPSRPSIKLA